MWWKIILGVVIGLIVVVVVVERVLAAKRRGLIKQAGRAREEGRVGEAVQLLRQAYDSTFGFVPKDLEILEAVGNHNALVVDELKELCRATSTTFPAEEIRRIAIAIHDASFARRYANQKFVHEGGVPISSMTNMDPRRDIGPGSMAKLEAGAVDSAVFQNYVARFEGNVTGDMQACLAALIHSDLEKTIIQEAADLFDEVLTEIENKAT